MKGGDAHTLSVGDMFRDPKTKHEYRIAGDALEEEGIEKKDDIYFVIDVRENKIIKRKKDFFEPLEYIGSYDFEKNKVTPVGGKSRRRRHKTRQSKRRKHRKSKSRRHRR
jgi:hypothetical protein